ncbi:MAG: leucyl aminopeptidase [Burkholderiales bacterium]|nr:MAG: leucyl aminopeptidase [Burkholderiales bacterium]
MQFSVKTSAPEKAKTDCAIVPVSGAKELTAGGRAIDAALDGALARGLKSGDLAKKAGSTLMLPGGVGIRRVLLVSLGQDAEATEKAFSDATRAALRALGTTASREALSLLTEAPVAARGTPWKVRVQVSVARDLAYRFDRLKSKPETDVKPLERLDIVADKREAAAAQTEADRSAAVADGVDLARDLGNLPGNVCTPSYLAQQARNMGRRHKLKVQVLERPQMEALKMGALLSVARGSEEPPKLIVIEYRGGPARQAPVVLVGKGITFDTGGISIKPAADMDEMKFDMAGAASVFGTLRAVVGMKLPINVVGLVPASENMPSGRATKPGDIVTSMSGQTVEILNTDAEGRLILCDSLTYAARFKPSTVIDIATLTGACVIALGHHNSGLFTKADALAAELVSAGREAGDTCWHMPLDDEYQEQLKSPFADMANVGGRAAGAVTAACFLARFAKGYDWAHLDIAGTAWKSGQNKGATGRPVPMLTRFLIARAEGR